MSEGGQLGGGGVGLVHKLSVRYLRAYRTVPYHTRGTYDKQRGGGEGRQGRGGAEQRGGRVEGGQRGGEAGQRGGEAEERGGRAEAAS